MCGAAGPVTAMIDPCRLTLLVCNMLKVHDLRAFTV